MTWALEEEISNPKETAPNVKNFTPKNHVKKKAKDVTPIGE